MKAQDLRIGNWILVSSPNNDMIIARAKTLEQCNWQHLKDIEQCNKEWVYEPIPLTEEWLLKMGFEINYNKFGYEAIPSESGFWIKYVERFNTFEVYSDLHFISGFKSVHQLQNLYHALTGEELTIKE